MLQLQQPIYVQCLKSNSSPAALETNGSIAAKTIMK